MTTGLRQSSHGVEPQEALRGLSPGEVRASPVQRLVRMHWPLSLTCQPEPHWLIRTSSPGVSPSASTVMAESEVGSGFSGVDCSCQGQIQGFRVCGIFGGNGEDGPDFAACLHASGGSASRDIATLSMSQSLSVTNWLFLNHRQPRVRIHGQGPQGCAGPRGNRHPRVCRVAGNAGAVNHGMALRCGWVFVVRAVTGGDGCNSDAPPIGCSGGAGLDIEPRFRGREPFLQFHQGELLNRPMANFSAIASLGVDGTSDPHRGWDRPRVSASPPGLAACMTAASRRWAMVNCSGVMGSRSGQ